MKFEAIIKLIRMPFIAMCIVAIIAQPALALDPETAASVNADATFWTGISSPCGTSSPGSSSADTGTGTATKSIAAFVDKYGKMAYDNSINTGVPYDFTLGQAIIESGYGQSGLTLKANNFFGIKGTYNGQSVKMRTREETSGGGTYWVMADFRKYPSPQDSFNDHDSLFRTAPRYAQALKYPNDAIQFLTEVKNAGYATSTTYIKDVGAIIKGVQAYVASKNLFPPSSEVKYNIQPVEGAVKGSGTSGSTSAGNCSTSKGDTSSYKNPLRDVPNVTSMRTDSGVDYGGDGPVYAIGKGEVVVASTTSGWPGGNFISYKLTEGAAAGKYIYVAENCAVKVEVKDKVDNTTVLCTMKNKYPFIEMGWANTNETTTALDAAPEGKASPYGVNFSDFMQTIGAPGGIPNTNIKPGVTLPSDWPTWK